jgi:hypothetical protein
MWARRSPVPVIVLKLRGLPYEAPCLYSQTLKLQTVINQPLIGCARL